MAKQFLRDFLQFNRKDRIGAISIIFILSFAFLLPKLNKTEGRIPLEQTNFLADLSDTLSNAQKSKSGTFQDDQLAAMQYEPSLNHAAELFYFDPNTASAADWKRLGLSQRTTRTILNYREKGGRFHKPEDLQKIWGIDPAFYVRVKNHIRIAGPPAREWKQASYYPVFDKADKKITVIEINSADSMGWIALPGIGSRLSSRILNFRDKLGGFHSVEQVGETYGVPDSTFQKIKSRLTVNTEAVRKININAATKDELKAHPYIKWSIANAIVEYRNQHGSYKSLDELKKIVLMEEETYHKVVPYLSIH